MKMDILTHTTFTAAHRFVFLPYQVVEVLSPVRILGHVMRVVTCSVRAQRSVWITHQDSAVSAHHLSLGTGRTVLCLVSKAFHSDLKISGLLDHALFTVDLCELMNPETAYSLSYLRFQNSAIPCALALGN